MNRKPIFDAVRKMLGRGFTQDEVAALDAACELAEGAVSATAAPVRTPAAPPSSGRRIGTAGTKLIQEFEACENDEGQAAGMFKAYPDPGSADGKPWTIGWGSTGPDITKDTVWDQAKCDERFAIDMERYANEVSRAIGDAPTTQNQFDALVSFHYNTGKIGSATLTKKHKARDYAGAKAEFGRWINNNGKPMKGLIRRRNAEADLYARP